MRLGTARAAATTLRDYDAAVLVLVVVCVCICYCESVIFVQYVCGCVCVVNIKYTVSKEWATALNSQFSRRGIEPSAKSTVDSHVCLM